MRTGARTKVSDPGLEAIEDELCRHAACHFAGAMAPHAVCERGHAELRIGDDRVLVELAHAAGIGEGGYLDEPARHRSNITGFGLAANAKKRSITCRSFDASGPGDRPCRT